MVGLDAALIIVLCRGWFITRAKVTLVFFLLFSILVFVPVFVLVEPLTVR